MIFQTVYQEGDDAYLVCTMDKDIGDMKYLNQSLAVFQLKPDYLGIAEKIYEPTFGSSTALQLPDSLIEY